MNIIFADIFFASVAFGIIGAGLFILGFLSDCVLPKIPCVKKFIESLPEFED